MTLRRMADGPEAVVDEPPSSHFPPLITVSDLAGATAAGNLGPDREQYSVCVRTTPPIFSSHGDSHRCAGVAEVTPV